MAGTTEYKQLMQELREFLVKGEELKLFLAKGEFLLKKLEDYSRTSSPLPEDEPRESLPSSPLPEDEPKRNIRSFTFEEISRKMGEVSSMRIPNEVGYEEQIREIEKELGPFRDREEEGDSEEEKEPCRAINARRQPCKVAAEPGKLYCNFHKNYREPSPKSKCANPCCLSCPSKPDPNGFCSKCRPRRSAK